MKYLKLPIDFSEILKKKRLKRCTKEESIAQNIMMIITSRYGEVVGRGKFGSKIWELEFRQLVKISTWEEEVRLSLQDSIKEYEKRLRNIEVKVLLSEIDDDFSSSKNCHVRRKAQISVKGIIVDSGIDFNFSTLVYISPLSQ